MGARNNLSHPDPGSTSGSATTDRAIDSLEQDMNRVLSDANIPAADPEHDNPAPTVVDTTTNPPVVDTPTIK